MQVAQIQAMATALSGAKTIGDLDALYVEWIGYSAVEDDAEATEASLRETLGDYIREVCYAAGVHVSTVGLNAE